MWLVLCAQHGHSLTDENPEWGLVVQGKSGKPGNLQTQE